MSDLKKLVRNPISYTVGGILSILGVLSAIAMDPSGGVYVLLSFVVENVMSIFTMSSIAGFTLAPEVSWLPEGPVVVIALLSGSIAVAVYASRLWDGFRDDVEDETEK